MSKTSSSQVITCKAAICWRAEESVTVEEIEIEPPQSFEIRVKMLYASLCHTDIICAKGFPIPLFPRVLGHEDVGMGEGVEDLEEGDLVIPTFIGECQECENCKSGKTNLCLKYPLILNGLMPDGTSRMSINGQKLYHLMTCSTWSEYMVINANYVVKINPSIDLPHASFLSCGFSTGFGLAWREANVEEGSSVAAIEGATKQGASKIIGIDKNEKKIEKGEAFGMTDFINPDGNSQKPISELIKDSTGGMGVDYCLECTGVGPLINEALLATKPGKGETLVAGVGTEFTVPINFLPLLFGGTLKGSIFGGLKIKSDLPILLDKCKDKEFSLDELLTHQVTLEDINKAFELLKQPDCVKDTTTVGLAKVNSEYKDLDIAIVKATNHVECPPKERHVRKIFSATSVIRPRADVAYCIHAISRRLAKTRNWIVAIKTLIVIHRTLREGDPTFREELLNYSRRGNILQISNFKDDSSPLAWDCSAWVRTYALFLEERLECFRTLKYDIEAERLTKASPAATKVHSKTRLLNGEDLLDQLPALQQLLYRLIGCQARPEGGAYNNYLVQYALALVLKESFKIYCAINDGIINLVDMFFEMTKHDAVKALNIYKRAGQQAENLAEFYEYCKGLELARNFQFPTLRQPPPTFLATMEEYVKEAPQSGSVHKRLEYTDNEPEKPSEPSEPAEQVEKVDDEETLIDMEEETKPEEGVEEPPLISTDATGDLLGLNEINPKAAELEESNALALAIVPPGVDPFSSSNALSELGKPNATGWELALVTTPSNPTSQPAQSKMGGGFDRLLLDSLYEDDIARRQIQLQNAGYGYGTSALHNPFEQQEDPFATSHGIAPPPNVQMVMMAQQQQQYQQQQMMMQQHQQQNQSMMYWTGARWRCNPDRVQNPGNAGAGGVIHDHHGDNQYRDTRDCISQLPDELLE
ncbi:unnamed protein product [Dovyalis caffra]|uniref:ENTH domain-containing protein n=1 Tax=Dovyalis caffra TaxID=77055 RepID=A0AAV1S5R2_9ROSI|nr:unnamed protein product [Dovyalis caffra]